MKPNDLKRYAAKVLEDLIKPKKERSTPQEEEHEALRQNMRSQFKKLKEKGLSIRIVTL